MKKPVIISIIAFLVVACIVAVSVAFVSCSKSTDATPDTAPTQATTEKATTAPTEKETTAPTQAATEAETTAPQQTQTSNENTDTQQNSDEDVMPTLKSLYQNTITPANRIITINSQDGNTLNLTISSSNEGATKIATADVTVKLVDVDTDGVAHGDGYFDYIDSFGNSGTGRISVSESAIYLEITEAYNSGSGWTIANASGKYI